jgi:translation elongation factor EF-Tu-like GTPase
MRRALARAAEAGAAGEVPVGAIIAHVDHGKTTLVDQMLRQSGEFAAHEKIAEQGMDSNGQERERGITILSKNTAITWRRGADGHARRNRRRCRARRVARPPSRCPAESGA